MAFIAVHIVLLALLALQGIHRFWLLRGLLVRQPPVKQQTAQPRVTVQLPLFNEPQVTPRLLRAVARLSYPKHLVDLQILDDSTDHTPQIVLENLHYLDGWDVAHIRRADRKGFKAGALAEGLKTAKGEFVLVLDADFVPQPELIEQLVERFEPDVAVVQGRWGHLNPLANLLTRCERILLDGHFFVEHASRYRLGHWFNFNGTAGMWRKSAIADAGGWEGDTLTEDLDLSLRAQMRGWRFIFAEDVVVPAELPASWSAFRSQQARWARGGVQVAKKLIPSIWRSGASLRVRLDAIAHLVQGVGWPIGTAVGLLLPFSLAVRYRIDADWMGAFDILVFGLAVGGWAAFYGVAGLRARSRSIGWLPFALAVGMGLGISQTRAVWLGLTGGQGVFVRTPKGGTRGAKMPPTFWLELVTALYLSGAVVLAGYNGWWTGVPFLTLYAVGYSLSAGWTLREMK